MMLQTFAQTPTSERVSCFRFDCLLLGSEPCETDVLKEIELPPNYEYTYVHVQADTLVYRHIPTVGPTHTYRHRQIHAIKTLTSTYTVEEKKSTALYVHVCTCMYMNVYENVLIYTFKCTYMHIHTHPYRYKCT
jgi:hypothetical protein